MALHLGPAGDLRARLAKEAKKRKGGTAFAGAAQPFSSHNLRQGKKKRKSGSSHNSSHPSPRKRPRK